MFIAHCNEVSTGTFALFFTGNDKLTMAGIFSMNLLMISYYIYVFYLVFRKKNNKIKEEDNLILVINSYLNLFYTLFWSCLFIPFIEINSGVLVVGSNSFLIEYRNVFDY